VYLLRVPIAIGICGKKSYIRYGKKSLIMKSLSLISISLVFVCACNNPPLKKEIIVTKRKDTLVKKPMEWEVLEKERRIRSITDTVTLFRKLFRPDTIIRKKLYWKSDTVSPKMIAVWNPDADAKFNMNISEDGKCYTNIDSIIKIPPSRMAKESYLVVFTTIQYMDDGGPGGCHGCGADYGCAYIVKNQDSGWFSIKEFDRNITRSGNWGVPADSIALVDFGGCYALDISDGYAGSGEVTQAEEFYSIPDFREVFSLQSEDSFDADGFDSTRTGDVSKAMSFVPGKKNNSYKDIKITIENTHYSKQKKKHITEKTTEYYSWGEDEGKYEQVKK
jgi:hypothetical protein